MILELLAVFHLLHIPPIQSKSHQFDYRTLYEEATSKISVFEVSNTHYYPLIHEESLQLAEKWSLLDENQTPVLRKRQR